MHTNCTVCVSLQVPLLYLSDADPDAGNEHPAFTGWELLDQLLRVWLQSLLLPSILAKVIGCRYTWQLWEKVHYHSQAKIEVQVRPIAIGTT